MLHSHPTLPTPPSPPSHPCPPFPSFSTGNHPHHPPCSSLMVRKSALILGVLSYYFKCETKSPHLVDFSRDLVEFSTQNDAKFNPQTPSNLSLRLLWNENHYFVIMSFWTLGGGGDPIYNLRSTGHGEEFAPSKLLSLLLPSPGRYDKVLLLETLPEQAFAARGSDGRTSNRQELLASVLRSQT